MKRQLEDSYRRAGEADAEARRVFEVHDFSSGQFIKCRSSKNRVRKCAPSPFHPKSSAPRVETRRRASCRKPR